MNVKAPEASRAPSAADLVESLLSLTHAIRRRHNASLASRDASVPRIRLLRSLMELGRPKMSNLAKSLGLSARTITTAVDSLEKDGYVARRPDPADRRATLLELTPEGKKHIKDWRAYQRQLAEDVMRPLSQAQRRQLMSLLQLIRAKGLGDAT